jgi:hypothetical protein
MASTGLEVANFVSGDDYNDSMTRKLMGVNNGELVFVTTSPGVSAALDCSKEVFQLEISSFDMNGDKIVDSYSFDSMDKCSKVADLVVRHRANLSYKSTIKFEMSDETKKVTKVSFPR